MFRYAELERLNTKLMVENLVEGREYYFITFNVIYRGFFMLIDDDAIFFNSGEIYFANHAPLRFQEMSLLLSELTGVAEVSEYSSVMDNKKAAE